MAPRDKHYHLLGETATSKPEARTSTFQLPAPLEIDDPVSVQLTITDDLPRWGDAGRVHEVLLRVRVMNVSEMAQLPFKLNGTVLPYSLLRKINEVYRMTAARYRANGGYWFIFKLDREHWPIKGVNTLAVSYTHLTLPTKA